MSPWVHILSLSTHPICHGLVIVVSEQAGQKSPKILRVKQWVGSRDRVTQVFWSPLWVSILGIRRGGGSHRLHNQCKGMSKLFSACAHVKLYMNLQIFDPTRLGRDERVWRCELDY